jgi:hypothetical protein
MYIVRTDIYVQFRSAIKFESNLGFPKRGLPTYVLKCKSGSSLTLASSFEFESQFG